MYVYYVCTKNKNKRLCARLGGEIRITATKMAPIQLETYYYVTVNEPNVTNLTHHGIGLCSSHTFEIFFFFAKTVSEENTFAVIHVQTMITHCAADDFAARRNFKHERQNEIAGDQKLA